MTVWGSVFVGHPDQIETIHTVSATISDRCSFLEGLVFGGQEAEQMSRSPALNTVDCGWGSIHRSLGGLASSSTTVPTTPDTTDPANIPTLARSVRWGSVKASPATNSETVKPIPATAESPKI